MAASITSKQVDCISSANRTLPVVKFLLGAPFSRVCLCLFSQGSLMFFVLLTQTRVIELKLAVTKLLTQRNIVLVVDSIPLSEPGYILSDKYPVWTT